MGVELSIYKIFTLTPAGIGCDRLNLDIYFLEDFNGKLYEIEVSGPGNQRFHSLAVKALKESGQWMPAIQNHYKVTCYYSLYIKF